MCIRPCQRHYLVWVIHLSCEPARISTLPLSKPYLVCGVWLHIPDTEITSSLKSTSSIPAPAFDLSYGSLVPYSHTNTNTVRGLLFIYVVLGSPRSVSPLSGCRYHGWTYYIHTGFGLCPFGAPNPHHCLGAWFGVNGDQHVVPSLHKHQNGLQPKKQMPNFVGLDIRCSIPRVI